MNQEEFRIRRELLLEETREDLVKVRKIDKKIEKLLKKAMRKQYDW